MRNLLLIVPLWLITAIAFAQERKISGQVLEKSTGETLVGASVTVVETGKSTSTDIKGEFSIQASTGQTLKFSFIGMTQVTVKVPETGTMRVEMEYTTNTLAAVVVTGYQVQRKSDLTGSVAVVDMSEAKDIPSGSALQNIQGRVPGLYIQADGSPSGAARSVSIRGVNTLGNTNPLYVIDGVPTTDPNIVQFMDPNSIESMQVLKDASASSIYGSRASNGVIIVTTKQGKNAVGITFNSSISAANNVRRLSMLNTREMGQVLWQASVNGGTPTSAHSALYTFREHTENGTRVLDEVIPVQFINGDPNIPSGDTDWQKEIFQTGIISQNNLTITGGSPRTSSLVSFSYFTNSGLVRNNDYKRYSGRINNSVNFFNGKLKIGENFQINKSKEHPMGNDQGAVASWNADGTARSGQLGNNTPLSLTTIIQPILPVHKLDGTYAGPIGAGFSDRMNPVFLADLDKDDVNNDLQTFGNVYIDITPVNNLIFRSSFGLDYTNNYDVNIERKFALGFLNRNINSMSVAQRHRLNWTLSNTVNYSLDIKKSRVSLVAGMEAIRNSIQVIQTVKRDFASEDPSYFQLGAGTGIATNNGFATGSQLLSYFGKANYSFNDKYLASATLRHDGSSRFGENNKFGLFPSVSVGWVISNEKFFQDHLKGISNLKLRAGAGTVGNQEIGDYSSFQQFGTNYGTVDPAVTTRASGTAYDIGGSNTGALPSGYVTLRTSNPNLRWETTDEINLGVDFGFLDQRITGGFDYFSRNTKDILITPATPGALGEGAIMTMNGATMANRGYELSLGYQDRKGAFSYSLDGNLSRFRDKITFLPDAVVRSFPGNVEKTILGHSRTSVFGYLADGLFQSQAAVDAHAAQPGKGVGRIRYRDLNGDNVINALDQDWLGTELPGFIYGLNAQLGYKNFNLSVFLRGVADVTVLDGSRTTSDFLGVGSGVNKGKRLLNAWTPQNSGSQIPAASLVNANSENRVSNYLLVKGDYLKIQNVQLSYSLPEAVVRKLNLNGFKIYGVADNAALFYNSSGANSFTGPDPETPGSIYPRPVRYTLGVDVKF